MFGCGWVAVLSCGALLADKGLSFMMSSLSPLFGPHAELMTWSHLEQDPKESV